MTFFTDLRWPNYQPTYPDSLLVALTFDKQKRGGVRSTLLLSGIGGIWRIHRPPVQVRRKSFLAQNLELQKRSWLVGPLCWGSTIIICLFIPHALQCSNAIYHGTQHQSRVMEGSAAIPATAQLQINSELSKANVKRKNLSAQQAQAKRPALDTRRAGTSGGDRKPWKGHILGYLKFQHFVSGLNQLD